MALKEYKPGTTFPGRMGRTIGESDPAWPSPHRAKEGAPNVLFIVIDDTGFGQLGCYGSPISTPNIDKLAKNGLFFTNMHTTALCSPSRSCILTGRNHHSNADVLHHRGIDRLSRRQWRDILRERLSVRNALATGLRHLLRRQVASVGRQSKSAPPVRMTTSFLARLRALLRVSRRRHPSILSRASRLRQSSGRAAEDPRRGLSSHGRSRRQGDQLASRTSNKSRPTNRSSCTSRPARTMLPIILRRNGRTSTKASSTRAGTSIARTFASQQELGVIPEDAKLSRHDPDVQDWSKLPADEKKLYARMQEVFAGFCEHVDPHVGRVVDVLEQLGELDNTLIISCRTMARAPKADRTGRLTRTSSSTTCRTI